MRPPPVSPVAVTMLNFSLSRAARKVWAIDYINHLHSRTHSSLGTLKRTVIRNKSISSARRSAVMKLKESDFEPCMSCALGNKTKKAPRKIEREQPFWTIDTSTNFPRSFAGNRCWFAVSFPDNWSVCGFAAHKSDAERFVKSNFRLWQSEYGGSLSRFKADRGGENSSAAFLQWCKDEGITAHRLAPGSSSGKSEKLIADLQRRQRAFVNHAAEKGGVEPESYDMFWDECINYANQVRLLMPSSTPATNGLSPYEFRYQESPPLHRLHPWGCKAVAHADAAKNKNKGRICMFLGLAQNFDDGWRFFDWRTRSIFHSRSATFFDNLFFTAGEKGAQLVQLPATDDPKPDEEAAKQKKLFSEMLAQIVEAEEKLHVEELEQFSDDEYEQFPPEPDARPVRRREQRQQFDPHLYQAAYDSETSFLHVQQRVLASMEEEELKKLIDLDIPIPQTYEEALSGPFREHWLKAIDAERAAMRLRKVFRVIRRSKMPRHRRTLTLKYVFDLKRKDGKIERFKARLTARGFSMRKNVDFKENFSPTPATASIKLMLALALQRKLPVHVSDVRTAFLYSKLPEDEYQFCEPPPGDDISPEFVLMCVRSLYGLRQASLLWRRRRKTFSL